MNDGSSSISVPLLMVLYTNDATEVRYNDGSCLQMAACGSTYIHHERPGDAVHPAHGMRMIHGRSQFTTSAYKQKVIEALDFRNRFAEQPYICQDLALKDQIMDLYANIESVTWPKNIKEANYEYLSDGSVRLVSKDEYCSLILSAHMQDYTVCYISKISQEKPKNKANFQAKCLDKLSEKQSPKHISRTIEDGVPLQRVSCQEEEKCEVRFPSSFVTNDKKSVQICHENLSTKILTSTPHDNAVPCALGHEKEQSESRPSSRGSGGSQEMEDIFQKPITPRMFKRQIGDDMNFSPISLASNQTSPQHSPRDVDESFRRYSTPTNKIAVQSSCQQATKKNQVCNMGEGSFLEYAAKTEDVTLTHSHNVKSKQTQHVSASISPQSCRNSQLAATKSNISSEGSDSHDTVNQLKTHSGSPTTKQMTKAGLPTVYTDTATHQINPEIQEENTLSSGREVQHRYTWMTHHCSVEEFTNTWRHPLLLARTLIENRELFLGHINNKSPRQKEEEKVHEKQEVVSSLLPKPLWISCVGQHLHIPPGKLLYDYDEDIEENISLFKLGKLKVILIEGVVFRLIRLSTTRMVEIYPGDGSVIMSQGLGAHFYRHLIPGPDLKVEERTYSMKSPPPTGPKSPYSIEKLIRRATRFLLQANQEDQMISAADVCCWKYTPKSVEILPTTLLEECSVPGHGKFCAYSNGHMRIVFEDRTALEMTCDFSKRIKGCMEHSNNNLEKSGDDPESLLVTQASVTTKARGVCKLLLPNGHYQIVDVNKPGLYRRYTDAALEWEAWVNSSPLERRTFYQNWDQKDSCTSIIEKELRRIKCFNYLTDQSLPTIGHHSLGPLKLPSDNSSSNGKGLYPQTQQKPHLDVGDKQNSEAAHYSRPANEMMVHVPESDKLVGKSDKTTLEMLQGFNSVRQALMQTSKVIKDIDGILQKK